MCHKEKVNFAWWMLKKNFGFDPEKCLGIVTNNINKSKILQWCEKPPARLGI